MAEWNPGSGQRYQLNADGRGWRGKRVCNLYEPFHVLNPMGGRVGFAEVAAHGLMPKNNKSVVHMYDGMANLKTARNCRMNTG